MADYNIFIRSAQSGRVGSSDQTTPWSRRAKGRSGDLNLESWSQSQEDSMMSNFKTMAGFLSNPDSLVSSGFSTALKAIPHIAAAALIVGVVTKISDFVIGDQLALESIQSGDFQASTAYQDFKASIHAVFTPVSTSIRHRQTLARIKTINTRNSYQAALLGDSTINNYHKRGV